MPPPLILDTNVYSDVIFREPVGRLKKLIVSSVVIQELMVIAAEPQQRALTKAFYEKLRNGEGVVPDADDWFHVGRCLSQLVRGYRGGDRLSKPEVNLLVRDALIARGAIKTGSLLITSNTGDFDKIKSIFKSLSFTSPSQYFQMRGR